MPISQRRIMRKSRDTILELEIGSFGHDVSGERGHYVLGVASISQLTKARELGGVIAGDQEPWTTPLGQLRLCSSL